MIHSYTRKKNGRCYRYYVPQMHKRHAAGTQRNANAPNLGHLPAADLENAVLAQVHAALAAPEVLIGVWRACLRHPEGAGLDEAQVVIGMRRIGEVWAQLFPAEQQRILRLLIERIQLHGDSTLSENWIKRGAHVSTTDLNQSIRHYLDQHNADPKPFIWRKSADAIIEAVGRAAGKLATL